MSRTGWVSLLVLAACSGGGETGVRGRVIGDDGYPAPGLTVLIAGRSVVTDDAGAFSLERVTIPYDVAVAAYGRASVFQGVTRRDLVLRLDASSLQASTEHFASVSGRLLGGAPLGTSDIGTEVVLGPWVWIWGTGAPTDYRIPFYWNGPEMAQREVIHAFQYREAPDFHTTEFLAHAVREVAVDAGVELSGIDLSLEPIGTTWIFGNLVVPDAGWTQTWAEVRLTLADGTSFDQGTTLWLDAGPYSLAVPSDLELTVTVEVFLARPVPLGPSQFGDVRVSMIVPGLKPGDQIPELRFTDAPTLLAPEPGAPLDGGTFRWRAGPAQLSQLVLRDRVTQITLTTSASSAALPDLSALGVALRPQDSIGYAVLGIDAPTSVDALVSPEDSIRVLVGGPQQYISLP